MEKCIAFSIFYESLSFVQCTEHILPNRNVGGSSKSKKIQKCPWVKQWMSEEKEKNNRQNSIIIANRVEMVRTFFNICASEVIKNCLIWIGIAPNHHQNIIQQFILYTELNGVFVFCFRMT